MAGFDFTLVVGVDENLSFVEFQKGIQNVINKVNGEQHRIKLGIDTNDASKHVEGLKSQLSELSSQASNVKGFESIVSTVDQLKGEISSLSKAIQGFQGISLNISTGSKNPVKQMAEYGQAARTTIEDLKRQANEMGRVFLNMFGGNNGVQAVAVQANKLKGIFDLPGKSQGEREYGKYGEMFPFISKVTNALGDVENLQERMQALREYIALMQEVAQVKGIKLPSTITAQDADAAIQEVNKIRDGTKEAEAEMDKLKSLFGSGINAEALNEQFTNIQTAINGVTEAISRLGMGTEVVAEIIHKIGEVVAAVDRLNTSLRSISPVNSVIDPNALQKIVEETQAEANTVTALSENYQSAEQAIRRYYAALREVAGEQDLIQKQTRVWSEENHQFEDRTVWASQSGKFAETATALNKLNEEVLRHTNLTSMDNMSVTEQERLLDILSTEEDSVVIAKERNAAASERISTASSQEAASINSLKGVIEDYILDEQIAREAAENEAAAHKEAAEAAREAAETRRSNAEAIQFAKQIIDDYYAVLIKLEKVEGGHITRDENGNYITDDAAKYGQLTAELNRCTNAYNGLMAMHNEDVSTSKTSADIRDYEAQKSREAALAIEELTRKREKSNSKVRDQQIAAEDRALQSYRTTLTSTEGAIQRWTAAERSKNQESRESYNRLKDSIEAMRQAKVQYDNGTGSLKNLNDKVAACKAQLKETEYTLKVNGDATKSWSDRLGSLAQKFSSWLSVSQVIMYAIRTIRKMITEVREIDAAMTQMQIVTRASADEMSSFADKMAQSAKKVGASVTDLIDSATTFARLGYNSDESSILAEYTAMLKNVGDIDVSDAQDAITAIVKAFNIDVGQIQSVMDKLVQTGNNFPISVSQIAEGMNNASSALAASGNSLEQSIALLTAANTTVNLCRAA